VAASLVAGAGAASYFAVQASGRAEEYRQQRDRADDESERAGRNERAARQSQQEALRNLYLSQMGQTHLAWRDGQVGRVLDLLDAQEPLRRGGHDLRSFEWYYLRRLCQAGHTTLVRGQQPLKAVTCSADGKIIASASEEPLGVKLWDAVTGKELCSLEGSVWGFFGNLAFSPDGKRIAARGRRGTQIWAADSGKVIRTFPPEDVEPAEGFLQFGSGVAFTPDGRGLAVTGKAIDLWDVHTGKKLNTFSAPLTDGVFASLVGYPACIAFTGDGERLVGGSVGVASYICVWEVNTAKRLLRLMHPGGVLGVSVSPDGKTIASAGADHVVRTWDIESKKEKWTLRGHTGVVTSVAFSSNGRWLLSGSLDGTVKVWDAGAGNLVRTLLGHTLGVTGLALRPDGRLASSGADGSVRIWEWDRDQEAFTFEEPFGPIRSLAFDPGGRYLASGSRGVSLWDVPAGKVARSFAEPVGSVDLAVAFSPDGKRLAARGPMVVKVWDIANGRKLFGESKLFGDHPLLSGLFDTDKEVSEREGFAFFGGVAFSPDGEHLVSCGDAVKIRDAEHGKNIRSLGNSGESKFNLTVAYSPDGKYVAAGGWGRVVTLWETASGEAVHTFPDFPDSISKVSFSRDGLRLLAASNSSARVWELPSGQEMFRFRLTSADKGTLLGMDISKASFSADGQRLATAPGDGTVKIWDVATGQQILSLTAPGSKVTSVAFSSDGHWLAAGGLEEPYKGILRIWDARPLEEKD
jgi:WD40 repeat protein